MLKIKIPENVKIQWGSDFIQVQGALGTVIKRKDDFSLAIKNNELYLWSLNNENNESMFLSMIKNLIIGVSKGYRKRLKLVGVGFKASLKDDSIFLKLGFSHEVDFKIPTDIQIIPSKAKGIFLLIKGKEKERVCQIAREIRNLRFPDSYKGKGVHYNKENLILKRGKREGK